MQVSKETIDRFYKVGWEKRWLLQLDEDLIPKNLGFRFRMSKTLKLIDKKPDDRFRVLDFGCGVGVYDVNLLHRFPRATVFGIDLAEKQIIAARELAKKAGVESRAFFAVGDVGDIGVFGPFDVILCSEVIAHLPDPSECLHTLWKASSEITQMIVSVPIKYYDQDKQVYHRQLLGDEFQAIESQNVQELDVSRDIYSYYYHLYSPREATDLLSHHGFRVRRSQTSYFLLRGCSGLLKRLANSINVRMKMDWLDRLIIFVYGYKHAEVMILDCCLEDTK